MRKRMLLLTMLAGCAAAPLAAALAQTGGTNAMPQTAIPLPAPARDALRAVAPALERYAERDLLGRLWQRADLSPRDRGIVTLSALIARNQMAELSAYAGLALDSGVTPGEIAEIVTHLAFYAGWGNAMAAVAELRPVFAERGIGADRLPPAAPAPLPLDEAAEAARAARVGRDVAPVVPGLDLFTTEILFRDLWLRPGLAPRDRSLVTASALIAAGHVAQLPYHLNRAMDAGLTRAQAAEMVTHLAFYAGWPNAFSAVPVVKAVFEGRAPMQETPR